MRQLFDPDQRRRIVALQPFLPNDTLFHDAAVPSGGQRRQWLTDAMSQVKESAVVFCDPDNGVTFEGECDSLRHISVGEVCDLYRAGHSVVVYHTPDRSRPHHEQIEHCLDRFRRGIPGLGLSWAAHFHRGSSRVFFVLAQETHAFLMDKAVRQLQSSVWARDGHFEVVTQDSRPDRSDTPGRQAGDDSRSLLPSPISKVQAPAETAPADADTVQDVGSSVRVVLNDNGGLNVAANPWLRRVDVPCRLCVGDRLTFSIEATFSGRRDMYRISPSALSLARQFGFGGNHLSGSTPLVFDATL
jgi:hypothetical protein